ncbi:hypothetical protein NL361_27515, partial [Klebsiella pneumoniae]|nr:hypothetical protein [Klebsiella pneumoniae]
NPHLFNFVGSFSGYLDTTTRGMPEAIMAAQRDAAAMIPARCGASQVPKTGSTTIRSWALKT